MTAFPSSPDRSTSRHDGATPDPVTLRLLLDQAAAELQAQPVPPMPAVLLEAGAERRSSPLSAPAAPPAADLPPARGGWAGVLGRLGRLGRPAGPGGPGAGPWGMGLGLGLVALAAAWLVVQPALVPPGSASGPWGEVAVRADELSFLPLVPAERWQRLASGGGGAAWVVRADLPAGRLAAWGLPYDPARAAEPVPAELLVHASGEVLALRVLALQ